MSSAAAIKPQSWWKRWLRQPRIPSGLGCGKGHSPSPPMDQMMRTRSSFLLSSDLSMKTMAWWHRNFSQSQSVKDLPQVHSLTGCFQLAMLVHYFATRHRLKRERSSMVCCVRVCMQLYVLCVLPLGLDWIGFFIVCKFSMMVVYIFVRFNCAVFLFCFYFLPHPEVSHTISQNIYK